jgi:hypothetical protein
MNSFINVEFVIPAKAGTQLFSWIPARGPSALGRNDELAEGNIILFFIRVHLR